MIIIDTDGAEQSWEWVKEKYNLLDIDRAPKDKDHWEVVELLEQIGNTSIVVRVLDIDSKPYSNILVMINWPDGEVDQETDKEGHTGFGLGIGSYYRPDRGEVGPHSIWIPYTPSTPTDVIHGLGMIGKTSHAHLEPTFQFVKGEGIEPSPPPPDYEKYISALEKIREVVNVICPLDGLGK